MKIITPIEQGALLSLNPTDAWRNNQPIRLSTIVSRFLFYIKELFRGGWSANDQKAFHSFYDRMRNNVQILRADLEQRGNLTATFHKIHTVLKISAKIENSCWGKHLISCNDGIYVQFRQDVEQIRQEAALKVDGWVQEAPLNRAAIARWIKASEPQRLFSVFLNLKEVPYRFDEIPRGAIILTDPFLYLKSAQLKRNGSLLKTIELHIKAFFCWLGTGLRYTHAELSLGNGETFDLDKKRGAWMQGEMKIQNRRDKTCYGAIVVPNEDEMLLAHRQSYIEKGLQPFDTFEDLWNAIEAEARRSTPLHKATIADIVRVGLVSKRPLDYAPMDAWSPGEKRYGCSATNSALFAKFGIDIGAQFAKMDKNVSPADLFASHFFRPFFIAK